MESRLILISPFAQRLRNSKPNPKSPTPDWWAAVLKDLDLPVVQIGLAGEPALVPDFRAGLSLGRITELVRACATWVSVDSFLPHLAHHVGIPGVVVWSRSDPNLFGYPDNWNLLKSREYLRKNPFGMWEEEEFDSEAFPEIAAVVLAVRQSIGLAAWRRAA